MNAILKIVGNRTKIDEIIVRLFQLLTSRIFIYQDQGVQPAGHKMIFTAVQTGFQI